MKRYCTAVALALLLFCAPLPAKVKPVSGTFVNFFWQDERNNYMNPQSSDNTDPELWAAKTAELHEMGVDYLVFMAVANEGQAVYPSSIMEHGYPDGCMSPVDAVMKTAESLGMHVFMSCGWARNQDDDLRDPFVIERQRAIMDELVALYADSPAFYGWYLPIESAFEPVLPEHAVEGVNRLTARARSLTPDKMVMISPYGICYADIDNPLFEQRIAALDVDIIAYQDEVGCVREPMPLPRLREHLRKLGEIHSRTGIAFWVNVESFTWEKPATNSRQSALVPAAFGRFLAQMQAASAGGAERVISFAVCGIFDKPGSAHPLGQPAVANQAYDSYMAWKAGDAKWKLLEHIFSSDVVSAPAKAVDAAYSQLCDGAFGEERVGDPAWQAFPEGKMSVVLDLGKMSKVKTLAVKFLNYTLSGVALPSEVTFSVSCDGKHFRKNKTVKLAPFKNDLHDCWTDIVLSKFSARARFVKVDAVAPDGCKLMCDEILVNPSVETSLRQEPRVDITLVPPGEISDKVDLDIRAGVVNTNDHSSSFKVKLIARKGLHRKLLCVKRFNLDAGSAQTVKTVMKTAGLSGDYEIVLKVNAGNKRYSKSSITTVVSSNQRSLAKIAGAWTGLYCWSELEGKHWNQDIKKLTAEDWRGIVRSMHEVGMDVVIIQELFRNEEYCGRHNTTPGNYNGLAFYPSDLYEGRMDIACPDPMEAIMTEADILGMQVFPGIGLFAWFDFTKESLQWHKQVAKEVWEKYGHHPSFYGFYVSEESGGSLDNWEWRNYERAQMRKGEIVKFFREFGAYCNAMAPGKPVMLATNSFDVLGAEQTYLKLFDYLDILCPFGFARMPENDITGKEAADFLQGLCDRKSCHFWFDLEAFLFYPDGSLYPRPFEEIMTDLTMFDNFEKIFCYQYPGVFNNLRLHPQVGEDAGIELYDKYKEYYLVGR